MNRTSILSFVIVLAGTGALLAATATSQVGPPKSSVSLQPTSPGTSQSGHANVSGTITAGQLVGGGAGIDSLNASNLTTGTLDPARLPLPLQLSGTNSVGLLRVTNNATTGGSAAIIGSSEAVSGATFGIFGKSHSPNGIGIYAEATHATGVTWGVQGLNYSSTGGGVFGWATAINGTGIGVEGRTSNPNGSAVYGWAPSTIGNTNGVYGQTDSSSGAGVRGFATTSSGTNYGGFFRTNSTNGNGVYSLANATTGQSYAGFFQNMSASGYGVYGVNYSPTGVTRGVYGQVASPEGIAVHGASLTNGGLTYGGFFESFSSSGRGVHGQANSTSGNATGVSGTSQSPFGSGVYGESISTGNGVAGFANNGGIGVLGRSNTNGVQGESSANWASGVFGSNSNAGYGVAGGSTAPGWAIFGFGNTGTSGTKSFRIDHPLDPENEYLIHYSSESPEPMNFYSGNAVTDDKGAAWIALPSYFSEVNRDFRYTLTVVDDSDGEEFVQVKVAKEIQGNKFKIRTSKGSIKVSWRVEAIRNDRYVQRYGSPSEIEKPEAERGTYQDPELYGQPQKRGLGFRMSKGQK